MFSTNRHVSFLVAMSVGALAASSQAAAAAQPVDSPPANCRSSFDVFHYSTAALRACGYRVYPLSAVKPLPGGGHAYVYNEYSGGVTTVTDLIPPEGFNPSTASNAQLDEYGFPTRPADPHALAVWQQEMSGWKGAAAPQPFDVADPYVQFDTEKNNIWAGYVVSGGAGAFNQAEAWYDEPHIYSSACGSNTAESTWAGIGGRYDGDLAQNGTAYGVDVAGIGSHQSFWEIVPGNGPHPRTLYGTPGYQFDASTRWYGSGYRFYYHNDYSGKTDAVDVGTSEYVGTSAEAITEHPSTLNNGLSNFGTFNFNQTEANGNEFFDHWSPTGGRHGLWMYDRLSGDLLANPGPLGFWGAFTMTQDHCS
jgi:hypothetical protein